jgi:hypothetical protein
LGRGRRRAGIAACGCVSEFAEAADELARLADHPGARLDDCLRVGLELTHAGLGGLANLASLALSRVADFVGLFGGGLAHLAGRTGGVVAHLAGLLLGLVVQLLRLPRRALDPVVCLGARAARDLVRRLMGTRDEALGLVGDLLERVLDRGFRSGGVRSSASTRLTRLTYWSTASRS